MRIIRVHQLGGPEHLQVEELDLPVPGPDQLLVALGAIGVNPVDTYIRSGAYGAQVLPYTPGLDGAGRVVAVGASITGRSPGDRVYLSGSVSGTYASHALCLAHQVHPLPERVTYEQGAALGIPYPTAYRALFQKARARAGETVLVHGASGGVGIAAIQWARAAGLHVLATASTPAGQALVLSEGAHEAFNHDAPGYTHDIVKATAGRGVDIVLEMLASLHLQSDLDMLAQAGRIAIIGSRGSVEINPRDCMKRDAEVFGVLYFNADSAALREIHAAIGAGLDAGTLRPVIGRTFPLAEASRAHQAVLERGAYGKIVLIPEGPALT